MECLQYVIQLNVDNHSLGLELLQQHLLPCLCETIETCKRSPNCDALYLSVARLLHTWGRCPEGSLQRKLLQSVFQDLSSALRRMAVGEKSEGNLQDDVCHSPTNNSQSDECTDATKEASLKEDPLELKEVLQSQVNFISCLLQKQNRVLKVSS